LKGGVKLKRWRKWINVIFAIATLLAIFCSYFLIFDYGKVSTTLDNYNKQRWFFYFLTVVAILGALLALYVFIRALALPTINNYIIDKNNSGEMLITSKAILDNVLITIRKYPEIRSSDAIVKVKNGKSNEINTKVKCGVYEGENLNSLGQIIKEDVAQSLETFTGYPVNKVDIEFYDIKKDSNKRVV
jgi:hypothetical protein